MELIRHEIPFDSKGYLDLLEKTFGREEAELEERQVNGSEIGLNRDIAFTVEENGTVCGTSHITFSEEAPGLCGLSGLCTDLSIRGRGMGKKLFSALVDEAENAHVEAAFLGTANPMASVMYESFGFSYLPGTHMMARFFGTDRFRFFQKFAKKQSHAEVRKLDAGLRIPIIPLLVNEGPGFLLDSNAGIFNRTYVTQLSTMGLYPKFLKLKEDGGQVFQMRSADGLCVGTASLKREPSCSLADFFTCSGYAEDGFRLIEAIQEEEKSAVFRIAEADTEKQELLRHCGYRKTKEEKQLYGLLAVDTGIWER